MESLKTSVSILHVPDLVWNGLFKVASDRINASPELVFPEFPSSIKTGQAAQ